MKKLKLKEVYDVFVDSTNILSSNLQKKLDEIKTEYTMNVIEEKIKLLMSICDGEDLDFDTIKSKYLKPKELIHVPSHTNNSFDSTTEETIMDMTEINGKKYYYEAKDKGFVYDMDSKQVGLYKNGKIVFC
jgi:hypothetical protein